MVIDSVEETEALENENTNRELESRKAKASSTPGKQAGGPSAFGGHFPQLLEVD